MQTVGPYRVVRELGAGAMGRVLEVVREGVQVPLALKLIDPAAVGPQAIERFIREARLLGSVQHPNVLRVYELGQAEAGPYIVTDKVDGVDLQGVADRGLDPQRSAQLVLRLCGALAAVHAAGILHRDLKPENVLVRAGGEPVLLDFGVAREAGAEQLTRTGTILGTPAYMSPEQARGSSPSELDVRTDLYGLGAILFHLLARRPPFSGGTLAEIVAAVLREEPRWPTADRPETPAALEAICRVAMAKDREQRYASADELGLDLERYLRGQPVEATARASALETTRKAKTPRRRRARSEPEAPVLTAETTLDAPADSPNASAPPAPSPGAPPRFELPPRVADRTPQVIGGYRIVSELGRGGMGVVYLVENEAGERLALKVLLGTNLRRRQRFAIEAEVMQFVGRHPNVLRLRDHGEDQGHLFMVMDLAEHGDLDAWLDEERLDQRAALEVLVKVADGLHFAHEAGVIHRDLKPANVLMTAEGDPLVADFGLAKDVQDSAEGLTKTGDLVGTISYMAPEQASSKHPVDRRTDIYSLGVILYRCLTGRLPFEGPPMAVLAMILDETPDPPRRHAPSVPAELEAICLAALAKVPDERYPTAVAMAEDLRRWLSGSPVLARLQTGPERVSNWLRRHRGVAVLSFLSLPVLAISGGLGLHSLQLERKREAQEALSSGIGELERGELDAAAAKLRRAVEIDPDAVRGWKELAWVAAQTDDIQQVSELLKRARTGHLFVTDARTHYLDGRVLQARAASLGGDERLGALDEARVAYEEALAGGYRDRRLVARLARLNAECAALKHGPQSETTEAMRWIVLREDPHDSALLADILRSRLGQGDVIEATRMWEEVFLRLGVDPRSSELQSLVSSDIEWALATLPAGGGAPLAERVRVAIAAPLYLRPTVRDLLLVAQSEESPILAEAAAGSLLALGETSFEAWATRAQGAPPENGVGLALTLLEHAIDLGDADAPALLRLAKEGPLLAREAMPLAIAIAATRAAPLGAQATKDVLAALSASASPESQLSVAVETARAALGLLTQGPSSQPLGESGLLLAEQLLLLPDSAPSPNARAGLRRRWRSALADSLDVHPSPGLQLARARDALESGQLSEARESARAASAADPSDLAAHELLTQIALIEGKKIELEAPGAESADPVAYERARRRVDFVREYGVPALRVWGDSQRIVIILKDTFPDRALGRLGLGEWHTAPDALRMSGATTLGSKFRLIRASSMEIASSHPSGGRCTVLMRLLETQLPGHRLAGYTYRLNSNGNHCELASAGVDLGLIPSRAAHLQGGSLVLRRHVLSGTNDGALVLARPPLARATRRSGTISIGVGPYNTEHWIRAITVIGRWDPEFQLPPLPDERPLHSVPADASLLVTNVRVAPRTLGQLRRAPLVMPVQGSWIGRLAGSPVVGVPALRGDVQVRAKVSTGKILASTSYAAGVALKARVGYRDTVWLELRGVQADAATAILRRPRVWLYVQRGVEWHTLVATLPVAGPTVHLSLTRRGDYVHARCGATPDRMQDLLPEPLYFPFEGPVDAVVHTRGGSARAVGHATFEDIEILQSR